MTELKDNRVRIIFDPDKLAVWELMVLEDGKLKDMLCIFAKHLSNGDGPISPDLPDKPLSELSAEELTTIQGSEAYKKLSLFSIKELRQAAKAFVSGVNTLDPN